MIVIVIVIVLHLVLWYIQGLHRVGFFVNVRVRKKLPSLAGRSIAAAHTKPPHAAVHRLGLGLGLGLSQASQSSSGRWRR